MCVSFIHECEGNQRECGGRSTSVSVDGECDSVAFHLSSMTRFVGLEYVCLGFGWWSVDAAEGAWT